MNVIAPNVRPRIPAGRIAPDDSQYYEAFFTYSIEFAGLAAGASTFESISIDAGSNFKWLQTTYFVFGTGEDPEQTDATRIIPPISILITDLSNGQQLQDRAIPLSLIGGDGNLPFVLPAPYVFQARSSVQFTIANFATDEDFSGTIALIGVKQWPLGGR